MNLTGEVDELLTACGLSLPRRESPTPQTKFALLTLLIASYAAASARPRVLAATFWSLASHCGLMNSGWLHSFMATNCRTVGNVCATCAVHSANARMLSLSPHASGSLDGLHFAEPVNA